MGRARRTCPKGQPATTIAARFSGGHTTNWTFTDGGYVNENTYAGAGDEFPADTVLVLRVQVGDAGYRDPAGNPVPETKFDGPGRGDALPRRPAGARHLEQERPRRRRSTLSTKAGELDRAGRAHLDRAGPARQGGNVTFTK